MIKKFKGKQKFYDDDVEITKLKACEKVLKSKSEQTIEICLKLVNWQGLALQYVEEDLRTLEICKEAFKQDGLAFEFIPDQYKTMEYCIKGLFRTFENYKYIPIAFKTPENHRKFVTENPYCVVLINQLDSVTDFDEELVLFAIDTAKIAVQTCNFHHNNVKLDELETCKWFLTRMKQTVKINKALLEWVPACFPFIKPELMTLDMCKKALIKNGLLLEHIPLELQIPEVCILAVSQNIKAFKFVAIKNKEICDLVKQIKSVPE